MRSAARSTGASPRRMHVSSSSASTLHFRSNRTVAVDLEADAPQPCSPLLGLLAQPLELAAVLVGEGGRSGEPELFAPTAPASRGRPTPDASSPPDHQNGGPRHGEWSSEASATRLRLRRRAPCQAGPGTAGRDLAVTSEQARRLESSHVPEDPRRTLHQGDGQEPPGAFPQPQLQVQQGRESSFLRAARAPGSVLRAMPRYDSRTSFPRRIGNRKHGRPCPRRAAVRGARPAGTILPL